VPLADVVSMQTRQTNLEGTGKVRLRRLVKEALRMRPDRIMGSMIVLTRQGAR
jgi:pilus assembly protein CpaF